MQEVLATQNGGDSYVINATTVKVVAVRVLTLEVQVEQVLVIPPIVEVLVQWWDK